MNQKGFVLSFALFSLALFLVVYAQIQSGQIQSLRMGSFQALDSSRAGRFANDLILDLNQLFDQSFRMDQNISQVDLYWSGKLPSPLNIVSNLLRYQSDISKLGKDVNVFVFIDLNNSTIDGNTNTGLNWSRDSTTKQFLILPRDSSTFANWIDINVYAEDSFDTNAGWSLGESGDTFINFRYSDQNTSHSIVSQGWVDSETLKFRTFSYNSGESLLIVSVGPLLGKNGSFGIDNNNTSALTVHYSIHWNMNADENATRAGYHIPLTIRTPDMNIDQNTIWVYA